MEKESVNDILRVANIDVNCSLNDPQVHPESQDKFVAYWAKNPYVIEAGKTRLFPRFIANHYAKHLADHILTSRELSVADPKERPLLIKQIILGVEESFSAAPEMTEGEKIAAEVNKLDEKVEVTEPVNPTGFVETEKVKEKQDESATPTEQRPTLRELKEEADKLGIGYKKNVTVDQLLNLIKSF